jgi:hypothetical protein
LEIAMNEAQARAFHETFADVETRFDQLEARIVSTELILHAIMQSSPSIDRTLSRIRELLAFKADVGRPQVVAEAKARLEHILKMYGELPKDQ